MVLPILDCQIIAPPMRSGNKLKLLPSPGSAKGIVNNTSGAARLSIHSMKGALRSSMLLRSTLYSAKNMGICTTMGMQPPSGLTPRFL